MKIIISNRIWTFIYLMYRFRLELTQSHMRLLWYEASLSTFCFTNHEKMFSSEFKSVGDGATGQFLVQISLNISLGF